MGGGGGGGGGGRSHEVIRFSMLQLCATVNPLIYHPLPLELAEASVHLVEGCSFLSFFFFLQIFLSNHF